MTLKTTFVGLACAALLLGACAEKPQTAQTRKSDGQPWAGAPGDPYTVSGWKPGDQASWEQQMRTRAQGQNEYSRATTTQ
jgi:hypothetical protein